MKRSTYFGGIIVGVIALQIIKNVDWNSTNEASVPTASTSQTQLQEIDNSGNNNKANVKNNAIVDVKKIAGKNQSEVNKILGKPIKQEQFEFEMGPDLTPMQVTMNYYLEMLEGDMGRVEVMFVDGGAQRIQINLVGKEYYKDAERNKNLPYVGLDIIEFDQAVNSVQKALYKENVFGFHRVTAADWLGTDNGNVEIITKEKYQ